MSGGATAAECVSPRRRRIFHARSPRPGRDAKRSRLASSIGVRVFHGKRSASTYSSDFSREALDRMLKSALELAKITSEDPFSGIPEASQLGSLPGDLDLYSADVYSLPGRRAHQLRAPRRESCARLRPSHQEFGRRIVRRRHRPQNSGQFSRICRRVPPVLLFGCGRAYRTDRKTAPCSATTGFQSRAISAAWIRRKKSERSRPSAPCGAWAARKVKTAQSSRHASIPWWRLRSWDIFLKASTETPSIAARHSWRANWARRSRASTSRSLTTAPWSEASAPRHSMAKVSRRGARSLSRRAC